MNKKAIIAIAVVAVLLIAGGVIYWQTHIGNRQLMDMNYHFDRAMVKLPNGDVVEGKLNSWLDFDDSDVIQVKIDGKTYLTSYVNASREAFRDYDARDLWLKKAVLNTASSSFFTSDRTIREYNARIWHLKPLNL